MTESRTVVPWQGDGKGQERGIIEGNEKMFRDDGYVILIVVMVSQGVYICLSSSNLQICAVYCMSIIPLKSCLKNSTFSYG